MLVFFIMKYLVYIIYSAQINKFYIGYTAGDINVRLRKHNTNHKGYTGKKLDWILKHIEEFTIKQDALEREKEIKRWKSRIKIEQLISTAIGHPDYNREGFRFES